MSVCFSCIGSSRDTSGAAWTGAWVAVAVAVAVRFKEEGAGTEVSAISWSESDS